MANYKEMYLVLAREVEKAVDILITAQRECEDIYIDSEEAEEKDSD